MELDGLSLEVLLAPTRSRGRTLRNLTVNVFHPFELLPGACSHGTFQWDPDVDDAREAPLTAAGAVTAYASERREGWVVFLEGHGDTLDPHRSVRSPRGTLALAALLASQRWHVAFHYRQLLDFLRERDIPVASPFPLDRLDGLDLPAGLY